MDITIFPFGRLAFIAVVFLIVVAWVLIVVLVGPRYRVWRQRLQGQADLAQAESETRIAIRRAEGEREAAIHLAHADIGRAKGTAAAIREVEGALGGPEGYLRWKYIQMLEEATATKEIIYIPTEAGLPILEAGRRKA